MTDDEIKQKIEEFLNELSFHCTSVRIFVTRPDAPDAQETACFTNGIGNIHAQQSQIREWMIMQEEYVREYARRNAYRDREDQG